MYVFWYDLIKPKYGKIEKLFYKDTNSFTVYIPKNFETKFDSPTYEIERILTIERKIENDGITKI